MLPLQDKDLDRLSREAAEQFEVEHGVSGWEHLENRLNQELPQKKDRRRFLFWLFFISLATGGTLIGILKNNMPVNPLTKNSINTSIETDNSIADNTTTGINSNAVNAPDNTISKNNQTGKTLQNQNNAPVVNSDLSENNHSQQQTTNTSKQAVGGTSIDKNQQTKQLTQPATPGNNSTTNIPSSGNKITGNKTVNPNLAINQQPVGLNYAIGRSDNNNTLVKNNRNKFKQPKQNQGHPQITDEDQSQGIKRATVLNRDTPASTSTGEPVTGNNNNDQSVATNNSTNPPTSNSTATTGNNTIAPPAADSAAKPVQQPVKKEADPKKIHNYKQPLEIGLLAGPDASTVDFGPLYKPGFNFGLQVGYRFNNRWSVNTAIIYTKKFYKADSQYFHPKYNSPPNWKLENVKGNCSMWEIPVNVRYDMAYNDKRRWFVSTGLSTYLMDKEAYDINYYSWNGSPYTYPYKSDSNSHYLFSVLNLSVGFERSLGKNFSIQAEPYLKIPMKDLGYGNMRMDSYGILFSLKYKPTFRSGKK